jgi:hypothetical protein
MYKKSALILGSSRQWRQRPSDHRRLQAAAAVRMGRRIFRRHLPHPGAGLGRRAGGGAAQVQAADGEVSAE